MKTIEALWAIGSAIFFLMIGSFLFMFLAAMAGFPIVAGPIIFLVLAVGGGWAAYKQRLATEVQVRSAAVAAAQASVERQVAAKQELDLEAQFLNRPPQLS